MHIVAHLGELGVFQLGPFARFGGIDLPGPARYRDSTAGDRARGILSQSGRRSGNEHEGAGCNGRNVRATHSDPSLRKLSRLDYSS